MFEKIQSTIAGVFSSKHQPQEEPAQERVKSIEDTIYQDEIIAMVNEELERRNQERLPFELQWRLNMNFLDGNQYCDINMSSQEIQEIAKQYWYQEREVYNHIAPIVETRLAKLGRVQPALTVRPATSDVSDISAAKVSTKILEATSHKIGLQTDIKEATIWSEICGTSFYKDGWDTSAGQLIGVVNDNPVHEGDISNYVCSPFEIYPDSCFSTSLEDCRSLIHARAYHVDEIEELWGVPLEGRDVDVFSISNTNVGTGGLGHAASTSRITTTTKQEHEIVIEYYERPSKRYPEGRFIIVAADTLLYYGALAYKVGEDKKRDFPFVRQVAVSRAGCFWGISIIERLIPIQRSFNAVKNRKHEYINRLAMGILDVEEGAYDTEDLEEDGLSPGKILTRRRGSQPARFLQNEGTPPIFGQEEQDLENQFILISGVSEISRNSKAPTGTGSGVALQLLIEQDDTRLSLTAENIRLAILQRGKHWLRFYKQFAVGPRMDRLVGDSGDVQVAEWNANDITSDDVVLETENELTQSPAQRKQMVFDLMQTGIFHDPTTGTFSKRMRVKVLDALGMGNWEASADTEELQINRAQRENMQLEAGQIPIIREIDDDELHIAEHKVFMLSGDFEKLIEKDPELADQMAYHVKQHEKAMDLKANNEMLKQQLMQQGYVPD